MTLQGTFPDVRPTDAVVHFLGAQQRVGQILSWSTTAIDVTVPADLLTGRYSLILAWHDPLTGAVVSSAATPVSLQVAGRTLPAIVSPAVKVLDQASLQQLDALPRAPLAPVATLTFRAPTPLLQSVQPGTILVAGISASTPYGLLRKVTGVSLQAGGLALQTTQASVLDAFQQGSFEAHAQVNAQSMPSVTPVPAAGACDAGFFDHLREQACLRSPPGLATGSHSGRCPDGELRQRMALAGTAAG
jgi:hypothetical protein